MNILVEEETRGDAKSEYLQVRFTILGERKKNSLEVPMWEKRVSISRNELALSEVQKLGEKIKANNAIDCFAKFYEDNFLTK